MSIPEGDRAATIKPAGREPILPSAAVLKAPDPHGDHESMYGP